MRDILISHVAEDASVATEIATALEGAGYTTWHYERYSSLGVSHLIQTSKAIEESKAFVLIISNGSLSSNEVTSEIEFLRSKNKPLFPTLHNIEWEMAMDANPTINIIIEGKRTAIPLNKPDLLKAIDALVKGLQTERNIASFITIAMTSSPSSPIDLPKRKL